jgi:hypothetical protein
MIVIQDVRATTMQDLRTELLSGLPSSPFQTFFREARHVGKSNLSYISNSVRSTGICT